MHFSFFLVFRPLARFSRSISGLANSRSEKQWKWFRLHAICWSLCFSNDHINRSTILGCYLLVDSIWEDDVCEGNASPIHLISCHTSETCWDWGWIDGGWSCSSAHWLQVIITHSCKSSDIAYVFHQVNLSINRRSALVPLGMLLLSPSLITRRLKDIQIRSFSIRATRSIWRVARWIGLTSGAKETVLNGDKLLLVWSIHKVLPSHWKERPLSTMAPLGVE